MDMKQVGTQIAALRRQKGLTQSELGDRLGVSFQAVSKWERGETLPDTPILPELADVLETSVDRLLRAGEQSLSYRGRLTVEQARQGILSLKRMGELLGRDHILYRHAVDGINERMNTAVEDAFSDDNVFECFVAEALLQALASGKYIDPTDVGNGFRGGHFRDIVLAACKKYGIR